MKLWEGLNKECSRGLAKTMRRAQNVTFVDAVVPTALGSRFETKKVLLLVTRGKTHTFPRVSGERQSEQWSKPNGVMVLGIVPASTHPLVLHFHSERVDMVRCCAGNMVHGAS